MKEGPWAVLWVKGAFTTPSTLLNNENFLLQCLHVGALSNKFYTSVGNQGYWIAFLHKFNVAITLFVQC